MNGSDLENNISVLVPDYLYESDGPLPLYQELSSSYNEEESSEYESDMSSSSYDYSELLSSINAGVYDLSSSAAVSLVEYEMMNNRLNILEDNLNTCVSFLIIFTVFALIKICFAIFNKILGLGQA